MAIGKASDFKVYPEQVHGGLVETLVQNTAAFNAASQGAIRLISNRVRGDYRYEAFFSNIASLITRRDTTSVSAATDLAVAMGEFISVKVNRKIGPVAQTLDAFRKVMAQQGANAQSLSFLIGTMVAKAMQVNQLNGAMASVVAALTAAASTNRYTVAASGTLATASLVSGLSLLGDQAGRVKVWVMHSKPYYDLVASQIAANIDGVSNFNIASATPVTLNRPVLVTDDAALKVVTGTGTAAVTDYMTLGLVDNAVVVEDTEEELIHSELVSGLENLVVRLQGEFAFNVGVKGAKWDVTNGGANPSDTALGTSTNWDAAATSFKDYAGIIVKSR